MLGISDEDVLRALVYLNSIAEAYNLPAVVLSLGSVAAYQSACDDDPRWQPIGVEVENLRTKNTATVAASGNLFQTTAISAPACLSNVVSVGATTKADAVANYSNNASFLSLLAPGGDGSVEGNVCNSSSSGGGTCSSVPGGGFKFSSGTSMAAPHVAGAFAVLKQQSPTASVTDLLSVLKSSGVPITDNRPGAPNPPITKSRIQLANTPWAARYNNAGPSAIVTDLSGNAYVAGGVGEGGESSQYLIVKYGPSGQQLWTATYGESWSGAGAVAVDQTGNVHVTGAKCVLLTSLSCEHWVADTVKYGSNGVQIWSARLDIGSVNAAYGIAVDGLGNVYVMGEICTGSCTFGDSMLFGTVKYDSNGNQIWIRTYTYAGLDRPTPFSSALALDASGNIYVTGWSCTTLVEGGCTSVAAVTIKYTSNGSQAWVVRDTNISQGMAVAVDSSGNVYVTGSNWESAPSATIKYDSNGNSLWVASAPDGQGGFALALDALDNVYVAGHFQNPTSQNTEYFTAKYNTNGIQQWLAFHASGFSPDWDTVASGIGVDSAGNGYVTGIACTSTDGSACTSWGYATLKYDSNGNRLWLVTQDGGLAGFSFYPAISVRGGSAYITAPAMNESGVSEMLTVKYTPN